MTTADFTAIMPLIIVAATSVLVMLLIAFYRCHILTVFLTLGGIVLSFVTLITSYSDLPRHVTSLLIIDHYAVFYSGLILAASFSVTVLSYGYLKKQEGRREEFYILLLLSILGSMVLVASSHFASLFLGLEVLSVSLYALIAYPRSREQNFEAGIKYLILAAASASALLFGMALIYAELGTLSLPDIAAKIHAFGTADIFLLTGTAMIIVGLGFKLAVVPFHMWTPDVYEGAPAPVTAFIASVSKGAVFALLLRYFSLIDIRSYDAMFLLFTVIAIASMFFGNLLALLQNNVKRVLAYSSIAHMGYLLVAFMAARAYAAQTVAFYLISYFVTIIGAFGIISVLSGKDREPDRIEDFVGMASRRPLLSGVFTAMLFSLAGIPLTAGFVGKFYIITAGASSLLWLLVITLVVNSAIGLYYYLRIIIAIYKPLAGPESFSLAPKVCLSGSIVLAVLLILLIWLGVYPGPFIDLIQAMISTKLT
jgi:NADH-quinone oxidoreductase subunit N